VRTAPRRPRRALPALDPPLSLATRGLGMDLVRADEASLSRERAH
jgi:hypothetical protein